MLTDLDCKVTKFCGEFIHQTIIKRYIKRSETTRLSGSLDFTFF